MKKLIFVIVSSCMIACVNGKKADPLPEAHEFFPVKSYFREQVKQVDSFKLPTRMYSTTNHKTDSSLITLNEFDSLAREFLDPDINDSLIKKFYKETSFADQSIPSITFNYSALSPDLPLQRMDVILSPDPVSFDQVKSVYIEKVAKEGDSSVSKKLYWKTDQYFRIITSKQAKGSPSVVTDIKVNWSAGG